ncbi:AMP-binding protein [Nonomuraea phyllanthi]|uniref:AMP-binding protein n=1 Tax=Nonomuraea phyllanthi TaxID=2219224 RepID=A0A5C4WDP4_9ACTN|nr:AMP-binding protein [Nonomuraea phyllanthi]KAB8193098.1 AMP-binding protein [Nonomuraea phyllanthi]
MTPDTPAETVPPASELITRVRRRRLDLPGAVACQVGGRTPRAVSYEEMALAVQRTTAALALAGVGHGMRTVLLVYPGVELGVLALSLLRLGAVPVMVDPGLPYADIRRCLERAAPEAFIGVPLAHAARLALGWARRSSRIAITVGPRRLWPGPTIAGLRAAAQGRCFSGHPPTGSAGGSAADLANHRANDLVDHPAPDPAALLVDGPAVDLANDPTHDMVAGLASAPAAGLVDDSVTELVNDPPTSSATDLVTGLAAGSLKDLTAGSAGTPVAREPGPDDVALIAYTSGSTGPPKGVPLRHRHLTAQLDLLDELGIIRPGTAMLSTFIPFALGAAALGATAVIPDMDPRHPMRADPAVLVSGIRRYGVATVFAAPALLDRLARHCAARGVVLDTLECVAVAGAPLPLPTLERVRACLPAAARVVSVYGATECLPVAAIEGRELAAARTAHPGAGTCLGRPLAGAEVRVIGVTDDPVGVWSDDLRVPTGTVGEIVVASPAVSDPYLDDPRATAMARIADGDRVWHRMGDLGHLDDQGRLWFAGRRSERVRTRGGDLCTDHVETLLAGVPGVRRTALVGVGPAGEQRPVLVVEREPGARRARVRAAVLEEAARHPRTAALREVLFHPGFPVDARHNSKIRRNVLATWAARRLRGGHG